MYPENCGLTFVPLYDASWQLREQFASSYRDPFQIINFQDILTDEPRVSHSLKSILGDEDPFRFVRMNSTTETEEDNDDRNAPVDSDYSEHAERIDNLIEIIDDDQDKGASAGNTLQNTIASLSFSNLETLQPKMRIDDNVVNFFLAHFAKNMEESGKYYVANPYLYDNLDRKNISNWFEEDLFTYNYLIIPIHTADHWALVVYGIFENTIEATILDSLPQSRSPFIPDKTVELIGAKFLKLAWTKYRNTSKFPTIQYRHFTRKYIQKNSYDCGICMLQYVDILLRGISTSFVKTITMVINAFDTKLSIIRVKYRDIISSACRSSPINKPESRKKILEKSDDKANSSKGISNGENHCYSNSILQILFRHDNFISDLEYVFLYEDPSPFMKQFLDTAKELISNNEDSFIDISNLRKLIFGLDRFKNFNSKKQQDSHEFLILLFEVLEIEIIETIGRNNIQTKENPIYHNFGFNISRTYQCSKCGNTTTNKNIEYMLPLLITPSKSFPTIDELIEDYCKVDTIENFHCEKGCVSGGSCSVSVLDIPRTPILYLLRPPLTPSSTTKNAQSIQIENTLKIADNMSFPLYGIIRHIGKSTTSGHYVAYVKNREWEYFDDAVNLKVLEETALHNSNSTPSILFYKEKNPIIRILPKPIIPTATTVQSEKKEDPGAVPLVPTTLPPPQKVCQNKYQHNQIEAFLKFQERQDRITSLLESLPDMPMNLVSRLNRQKEKYEKEEIRLTRHLLHQFDFFSETMTSSHEEESEEEEGVVDEELQGKKKRKGESLSMNVYKKKKNVK